MSIIDRILGRGAAGVSQGQAPVRPPPVTELPASATPARRGGDPPLSTGDAVVRLYDQFGRKVEIGREAWRNNVLLPGLSAQRDDPDALRALITAALDEQFAADVLEPARHLHDHDPQPRRGAALLGATLLQLGDPTAARALLERAIATHGADPYLLATLARAHAAAGDDDGALALIWRALQLDPNDESALNLAIARAHAAGGTQAVLAAYLRAASMPGSWRAQCWLARHALEFNQPDEATRFYEEALSNAAPVPAELLLQLSGELGNRGYPELLIRLTQQSFEPAAHGLIVAENLLRACIDLGMMAEARKLLEQLYAQQRPEWRAHLAAWEREINDAQGRPADADTAHEILITQFDVPVWARGALGFDAVLPAKARTAPRIHFMCGSCAPAETGVRPSPDIADPGRMARALPMLLAEEVYLRTQAHSAFLLPWRKQEGFIRAAERWTRAALPHADPPPHLHVFLHLEARTTPWLIEITLDNGRPDSPPVVFEQAFGPASAGQDVTVLLAEVISRLSDLLTLHPTRTDSALAPADGVLAMPPAESLPGYLMGLELALACALPAQQAGRDEFPRAERLSFELLLDAALRSGALARPRMLLLGALETHTGHRPDIARELLGRMSQLQLRTPLPAGVCRELVSNAMSTLARKAGAG